MIKLDTPLVTSPQYRSIAPIIIKWLERSNEPDFPYRITLRAPNVNRDPRVPIDTILTRSKVVFIHRNSHFKITINISKVAIDSIGGIIRSPKSHPYSNFLQNFENNEICYMFLGHSVSSIDTGKPKEDILDWVYEILQHSGFHLIFWEGV